MHFFIGKFKNTIAWNILQGLQLQLPQKEVTKFLKFLILVIVASDVFVEWPDILFHFIGDDQNLFFDGQDQYHSI